MAKKESWWGKPSRKEWLLYFLILLCGFILLSLWGLVIGLFVILLYRKCYKKEKLTREHWIGSKKEWLVASILIAIGLIIMFYLLIFVFV